MCPGSQHYTLLAGCRQGVPTWQSTTLSASWLLPSSVTTAHLLLEPGPSRRTSPPTTRTPSLAATSALHYRVDIAFWQWSNNDSWQCSE